MPVKPAAGISAGGDILLMFSPSIRLRSSAMSKVRADANGVHLFCLQGSFKFEKNTIAKKNHE